MQFRVLGPLEVRTDAGPVVLRGARSRALLTALLLSPGQLVPAHRLARALWADSEPADVDNAVHTAVSRLRRALGPAAALVVTRPPGYLLDVGREDVDAEVFEMRSRAAVERLRDDPAGALAEIDAALDLWRGPAYGEFADGFARAAATRLEELRIGAREHRVDALLRIGAVVTATAAALDLADQHPLRERPVELSVRALAAAGRIHEALAAYRRHRDYVREELGLDPSPALRDLHAQVLRAELTAAAPPARPAAGPGVAPAARPRLPRLPSPIVGRDDVLARLGELMDSRRLVTLVGPGGVGKTRVALEFAYRVAAQRRAVWWVDVVPVTRDRLVDAIATATGVEVGGGDDPAEDLFRGLAAHHGLLVLDNAEHLLDALAGLVERLLDVQPGLSVLVTSRERLAVDGEVVLALPPFAVPADADERNPAVRLFVERAPGMAARPLDPGQVALVAGACRRLDGLPLAIELGAARADALGLSTLLDRLGDRLDLLAGGRRTADRRHRTLRAVVEWSHQLLTADEAALFARLAVFPGSFGLDQVEAVCADERLPTPSIAPLLARLVEQSLVRRVHDRFGMLETLRVHAGERLDALGDRVAWQARHARVTAHRLAAHSARLWTPDEPAAVRALTELSDDLHAAWLYASRYDRPLAVRMAADVHDFAYGRQRLDLLRWGNAVAGWEAAREVAGPGGDLARALATAATAAWSSGRRAEAAALAERGVRLAGGPDSPAAVQALRVRAHLAMFDGRADEAAASYRTLAASLRAGGEPTRALVFEHAAAQALLYAGRAREAAAVVDALRAEVAGTGHPTTMAWASYVSGLVAETTEPDRALAAYAAAVEHGAAADCRLFVTLARSSAAALTARTGAHAEAFAALGVVLDLWAQLSNEFMQWWVLAQVVVVLAALGRDRDAADLGAAVMAAGDRRPHVGTEEARLAAALDELRGRLGPGLMTPGSAGVGPGLAEAVALARRAMAAAGVAAARP